MRLLVVIPFHDGDAHLAVRLLEWMADLGGCGGRSGVLVCSKRTSAEALGRVVDAAARLFDPVPVLHPTTALPNEKWPRGPNWLFEAGARYARDVAKRPFLWLEPDAVPMMADWLDRLEVVYEECGKPFMGAAIDCKGQTKSLAGVAVYPREALDYLLPWMANRDVPWDIAGGPVIWPMAHVTPLIHHFWGAEDSPPTIRETHHPDNPPNTLLLEAIPANTVLFHRSKDASLIELLRSRRARGAASSGTPAPATTTRPTIWHVVEKHTAPTLADTHRLQRAWDSWLPLYQRGDMRPCHFWKPARTAWGMADRRNLPYLRDMLAGGMETAAPGDIILLTNGDALLHPKLPALVREALAQQPAASSFRLNVGSVIPGLLNKAPAELARLFKPDYGRDLFAFTKKWLEMHWSRIPDMLSGEWEWDLVMALLVRSTMGVVTSTTQALGVPTPAELPPGYVLHERHAPAWQQPATLEAPGKLWNRAMARAWYQDAGLDALYTLG